MNNYFSTIHYEEGEGQDSYEGIELRKPDGQSILWHTDDFVKDYTNFISYLKENVQEGEIVLGSSTMDDFFYEEPQRYNTEELNG